MLDVVVLQRTLELPALAPGIAIACPGGATDAGVFVSTSGSDANPGTPAAPLQSLAEGIARAQLLGSTQVWVGSGDYFGPQLMLASGVSITGGFDPATWQASLDQTRYWALTAIAARAISVVAPTKLERIQIAAANATGSSGTDCDSYGSSGGGGGAGGCGATGGQGGSGGGGSIALYLYLSSLSLRRPGSRPDPRRGGAGGSRGLGGIGGAGGSVALRRKR